MNQVEQATDQRDERSVPIKVNKALVDMTSHEVSGRDILAAAVAQHVPGVQIDFVLSREVAHDKYKVVPPNETIKIHAGEKFIANVPDDNS
jgi:hypothetical protein